MLDVVRSPKVLIEGPGSAQLEGHLCRGWLITTSPDIPTGRRRDTFEDVTHGRSANQRLSEDKTGGRCGEFFGLGGGKIVLRRVVTPSIRCNLRTRHLSGRRPP